MRRQAGEQPSRPDERQPVGRSERTTISGASALGIRVEPDGIGLPVGPSQDSGKYDEDCDDDNGHQQRVSGHCSLPHDLQHYFAAAGRRH
jgi:hypothetical protein